MDSSRKKSDDQFAADLQEAFVDDPLLQPAGASVAVVSLRKAPKSGTSSADVEQHHCHHDHHHQDHHDHH